MRAEKVMGFQATKMPIKNFKGKPIKGQSGSCDVQVRLDWEPTSARKGKGIGCHINLTICGLKYAIQYYAPPNADPSNAITLCYDDRYVTYQFLRVHNHHKQKLGGNIAYFKNWMQTMKESKTVTSKKVKGNLDRLFRYSEKHDEWERYKVATQCQ